MLKVLLKKQFAEFFRTFFYDQKKKAARSKLSVIAWIVVFILIMVGMVGGMFTVLAVTLCDVLAEAKLDWLYFALFGLLSILLGIFASVFNTYQSLYLAKDNDLLLSMPIPVRTIMASRLLGVYLMGFMYSALVIIPAVAVYFIGGHFSIRALIGCLLLIAVISVIVLLLSCALGWVVAKISLRLKNKSFITVLVSLVFIGLYYFFYFKAQALLQDLMLNAAVYGEKIKGAAYGVYLFGRMGQGDPLALAVFVCATAALFLLTWYVLSRSFLKIATASGAVAKVKYRQKALKGSGVSAALLRREFCRFSASANYMLNCGLATLLLPLAGIAILIKGKELFGAITAVFGGMDGVSSVLLCAAVCMVASMNDMATPSVSLEGKSLWLVKSLPVTPWQVLRAKVCLQLVITLPAAAVCLILSAFALPDPFYVAALAFLTVFAYCVLSALSGLFLGLKMPNLDWTNETVPIKQSANVVVATFGGWGYALLLGGGFLLFGSRIGAAAYLGIFLLLTCLASVLLYRWLRTAGARIFSAL